MPRQLSLKTPDEIRGAIERHQDAILQLEETQRGVSRDIESRIARAAQHAGASAFGSNGAYRGVFGSEDEARAFGLYILSNQMDPKAAEAAVNAAPRSGLGVFMRDMTSNPDATGGATVPIEFSTRIKLMLESFGVFFRNTFVMPMTTDQLSFMK